MEMYEYKSPIKSAITSIADLSDIDISTYPSLKLRWTLSRNSVTDTSPTVTNPSVTWEGGLEVIQPTKPMSVDFMQSSPTADTYYTALDISNGKGKVNRITTMMSGGSNQYYWIKITVDGVSYILHNANSATALSRGISSRLSTSSGDAVVAFDWLGEIYFKNSLKIEVKQINIGGTLHCSVDYALV